MDSPWRIRLKGLDADISDLMSCLQGRSRIIQQDRLYYLESEILNSSDLNETTQTAGHLLRVISSLARVRRSIAQPVELGAVCWRDPSGFWRQVLMAGEKITVYSNVVRLSDMGLFDRCVEVALRDENIRMNLEDFLGEWDFPRLRRIGEFMLLDLGAGDVKKGLQELVKRNWASDQQCALFWETVNHGDRQSLGAHSQLRRGPGKTTMNVIEAGEFLRDLLAKWVESKA
jgi:hypothetical protein